MPLLALPFVLPAVIGGAASIAGGAIAAHAAGNAADAQVNAANRAADLQHQDAAQALAENQRQFGIGQNNLAPFLKTGTSANANLASLMGVLPKNATLPGTGTAGTPGSWQFPEHSTISNFNPRGDFGLEMDGGDLASRQRNIMTEGDQGEFTPGTPGTPDQSLASLVNPELGAPGSLAQGWQGGEFKAPTDVTEQNDPGYQFRLAQGQKAIEQSAAARGGLLTGGTAKALNDYSQGQASNEYGNVYARALGQYQQNYNQFQQQSADKYNRLANLSGIGQITAQQLGQLGGDSARNTANILLTSGQQIGQNYNNAGAATASGYVGGANAWNGALSGIGNNAMSLGMLNLLAKNNNPVTNGGIAPGWNITL